MSLAQWAVFHQRVGDLPTHFREVFDLLWYDGLPQPEAAILLEVSLKILKRRWREARLLLGERLNAQGSPDDSNNATH